MTTALSPREREVLRLLSDGHSRKAVAAHLRIGENTVKDHSRMARAKLGATNTTHAAVMAARAGLL